MICTPHQILLRRLDQEGSGGWCMCHRLETVDVYTVLVGKLKERHTSKICK
jgi:hypothetical protein